MKKYFIKDNVCTPYKLILGRVNNYLKANGWQDVTSAQEANVCLIGCCGAFHSLEDDALGLIADAKKTSAEVNVFGCLVRISPEKVSAMKPHRVFTAPDWEEMESLVEHPIVPLNAVPDVNEFRLQEEYRLYDPGKQFVLIQTGCSSSCPYCPHKLGIGELKSRPQNEILRQVQELASRGTHSIILHGNDTGSYGTDLGTVTFPELVKKVLKISPNIHLTQINAGWAYHYRRELFPLLMNDKIKDFQVLIQPVSDRLLKLMGRKPVVKALYKDLKNLRMVRKDMLLRTDVIIGYPTATEEEERETLEYVTKLFDEVAVHGFERFKHTRIEKMGLPFYSPDQVNVRVEKAINYFKNFPNLLVHRGGQVIKTLEAIERPKDELRKKHNATFALKAILPRIKNGVLND